MLLKQNDMDQRGASSSRATPSLLKRQPRPKNEIEGRAQGWTIKRLRDSIGLDRMTVLKMLKGGLPPTIAIAMYQSSAISNITTTVGFISAIMAVSSQCLLPRAKFMKIMFYSLLSTCISAALCCLGLLAAVKARLHTTPLHGSVDEYNSSACAVSAVWLIFAIWISNTLRAYKQQELQDPMVAFAIFASITLTHVPQVLTISTGLAFIKQLLLAFMFGFAVATGVSLVVLPITNRRNFFLGTQKYTATIEDVLKALKAHVQSLYSDEQHKESGERAALESAKATASVLRSTMISFIRTHDRLHGDLIYAKNEIAWGKLAASDLTDIFSRLRSLFLPLAGISMLPDILKSLDDGWKINQEKNDRSKVAVSWGQFLQPLMEELSVASDLVTAGTQHALLNLGIVRAKGLSRWFRGSESRGETDVEQTENDCLPGSAGFASCHERDIKAFVTRKRDRDIPSSPFTFVTSDNMNESFHPANFEGSEDFFVFLFTQHLLRSVLLATLELVKFADSKVSDGRMEHNHFIFPQGLMIKAWLGLNSERSNESDPADASEGDLSNEPEGAVDPEHLAPANAWERLGHKLRGLSQILASDQSAFGFRAAAASFSVAILAFLHQTQDFFAKQRLIWPLIVIAFGMSPTSGAGLFSFAGRILATVVSLVLSLIVWYIVDGHVAGTIVFLYFANVVEYYFYVRYPRLIGPCVIAIVTLNVIVAYELQVAKLGTAVETASSGQPYYPIYLFGPYKLLAVIAGCTIAFIWTIFPYPITSRSQVRKLLGRSLFVLANFYSCMHTTIEVWIYGSQIDIQPSTQLLAETRKKLFSDEMTLITAMRSFSQFTVYEPPVGGKFPKSTYDNIISEIQSVAISMALMAKIPESLGESAQHQEQEWLRRLAALIESTEFNSHSVTSLLCHLSAAVSTGTALPPHLSPPTPFPLARKLRMLNDGIFDKENVQDPTFAAFASLEVLSSMVNNNLTQLLSNVKSLVGEVKFDGYLKRQPRNPNVVQGKKD